jgi:5,10-methenyltetrahydrofolate synthetase
MQPEAIKEFRKSERVRLIAAREALDEAALRGYRERIDAHLARLFATLPQGPVAFCWPIRNEYDARHFAATLRRHGALTALPMVAGPGQKLAFREWHSGVILEAGPLGIPYPAEGRVLEPRVIVLPMVGFDEQGYRLGYGGAYFDRTLGGMQAKPIAIGVAYELARLATIHPQWWDVPMDWVVTERGAYRRAQGGLVLEEKKPSA